MSSTVLRVGVMAMTFMSHGSSEKAGAPSVEASVGASTAVVVPADRAPGYRGIWYAIGPTGDRYGFKYSGGLGTYPAQQGPVAVHDPRTGMTFFVYGGATPRNTLTYCVGAFDHARGLVLRPRVWAEKPDTDDAHDNPVLTVDREGHLWMFCNTHGENRTSHVLRSAVAGSVDASVRRLAASESSAVDAFGPALRFSYAQPHAPGGDGDPIVLLYTRYAGGRDRHLMVSGTRDGSRWSTPRVLSSMERGQYQVSASRGDGTLFTVFDVHPERGGLDARTNLYCLRSADRGVTWTDVRGDPVRIPLLTRADAASALVRDYAAEGRLVYIKGLTFDADGHPVILHLTSATHLPGPQPAPLRVRTARWTGTDWEVRDVVETDHNYDHGELEVTADGRWRIIGTFLPGPQPFTTGGDVAVWESRNLGATWTLTHRLTTSAEVNHTYPRIVVGARDDFWALWTDGDTLRPSSSSLYFGTRDGRVFRLPREFPAGADWAAPEPVGVTR